MSQNQKTKYVVADTFNIQAPKSATVVGMKEPSDYVPEFIESYEFREEHIRDCLAWWKFASRGEGLFLTGPTGSGKSSLLLQIASRLNWPVQRITGHARLEFSDLVGRPVIQSDGSMAFQYGPLAHAMKEGHMFLLDELDMLDPGVSAGLNGIVQGEPLTIPENGGEVIHPHPDFRFVATGNTAGGGDDGFYAGTTRQNEAFLDRFWVVFVDYPEKETELRILSASVDNMEQSQIEKFVDVANEVRKQFTNDQIEVTFSTRVLTRWAQMTGFFYAVSAKGQSPVHYAADRAILNRAEPETRQAVHEIVQRFFGE
jgi:cobaltochelatase CobS